MACTDDHVVRDRRGHLERDERADEVEDRTRSRPRPCGGIARVEIEVATTFAVSWKPFVKSKTSAVATTITTMISLPMCRLVPV